MCVCREYSVYTIKIQYLNSSMPMHIQAHIHIYIQTVDVYLHMYKDIAVPCPYINKHTNAQAQTDTYRY